jgi:threonine synthase
LRLRAELGAPRLFLKDDTCNPSGSFKDRASYLVAAFARKHGIHEIALASTGNAASSMACVGAAAGLSITVYLPKAAPAAKRVQVLQYGARLVEVEGTYDQAFDESLDYSVRTGVLSRNTAYNPLTIEGKKTAAYEMARDLGKACGKDWAAPDHVFVPTGDGVILAGVIKGFEELLALGRIDRLPVFWAAQAEGSSAIVRALATGGFEPRPSSTLADSSPSTSRATAASPCRSLENMTEEASSFRTMPFWRPNAGSRRARASSPSPPAPAPSPVI